MKFLIATLAFALMVQVSVSKPHAPSDKTVQESEGVGTLDKQSVLRIEPIIRATMEQFPSHDIDNITVAVTIQFSKSKPDIKIPDTAETSASEKFLQEVENVGTMAKQLLPRVESILRATYKQFPSNAYDSTNLMGFVLSFVDKYNTKSHRCLKETFETLNRLVVYIRMMQEDKQREYQIAFDVYHQSGGTALEADLAEWEKAITKDNFLARFTEHDKEVC